MLVVCVILGMKNRDINRWKCRPGSFALSFGTGDNLFDRKQSHLTHRAYQPNQQLFLNSHHSTPFTNNITIKNRKYLIKLRGKALLYLQNYWKWTDIKILL